MILARRVSRVTAVVLLAVGSLSVAACGSGGDTSAPPETDAPTSSAAAVDAAPAGATPTPTDALTAPSSAPPASPAPPIVVPEALDFEATLVGGAPFAGASLAGTPVALWFWAPT